MSHDTSGDQPVELALDEESDGTQNMFALAGPWLDTLANGHVIVFDELHDTCIRHSCGFLWIDFTILRRIRRVRSSYSPRTTLLSSARTSSGAIRSGFAKGMRATRRRSFR